MVEKLRQSFLNPEKEYTPIPFWFWNDALRKEEIIRQIHDFNEKGVNGFVIHPIHLWNLVVVELKKIRYLKRRRLPMKIVVLTKGPL